MVKLILSVLSIVVIVFLAFALLSRGANVLPTPSPTILPSTEVSITLISIEGKVDGKIIGCNDSLVTVRRSHSQAGQTDVENALMELLSTEVEVNEEGNQLYNSLANSELRVDRVEEADDVINVYLTGQIQLGGTCDTPRFQEQLRSTIIENSNASTAHIFINNQPMEEALSTR